jgi:PAS domain S-box-containing protein
MKPLSLPHNRGKNEEKYKLLVDALPLSVYISLPDALQVHYLNPAMERFLEYTAKELINNQQLWENIIHPDDRKRVFDTIEQARTTKQAVDINHRFITKSNISLHVVHSILWEKDEKGNLVSMLGVIQDISEQQLLLSSPIPSLELDFSQLKHYCDKLNFKNEKEIRNYFEIHPEKLEYCSKLVVVKGLNEAILKLFRAENEEAFLKAYKKRFLRDSDEVFMNEIIAMVDGEDKFESPVYVFSLDGKFHHVQLQWVVPPSYQRSYGKVLVSLIDTTLQRQMTGLINIKNFAIESSKSGIATTDLQGNITFSNKAFVQLWGIEDIPSIIGKPIKTYIPRANKAENILNMIHAKEKWRGILKVEKPDKSISYLDGIGEISYDEYGEPLGIVFSFIDITEHKKTEEIRLEFTNIVAHELKTPITPLKTFLNMMQDDPKTVGINDKGKEFITICLRNVERLNELIGDILDISKLQAGGMKFNMQNIDFLKVINEEIIEFTALAKDKGLLLKSVIPKTLPSIKGDKERLAQVISNLLKNAFKFTDPFKGRGRIMLTIKVMGDAIQVSIVDDGIGMKKDDIPKLFTKFFQAEDITTRRTKGSGLGLVICKEIIKAHGGDIWADSPGKGLGSTFTFTLPFHNVEAPKRQQLKRGKTMRLKTIDERVSEKGKTIKKKESEKNASDTMLEKAEQLLGIF